VALVIVATMTETVTCDKWQVTDSQKGENCCINTVEKDPHIPRCFYLIGANIVKFLREHNIIDEFWTFGKNAQSG
jgi:hypothetical protein